MYSLTYCANKHPPFNRNYQKCMTVICGYGCIHIRKKKKKHKEINDYDYYAKQDKINQVFRLKTY